MQHERPTAPRLLGISLTALLLAAPTLALSQPSTMPANPAPGTMRPMNPATDPTAPAAIAPIPAPTATLNTAAGGTSLAVRPRVSQIIGSRVYNDRDQSVGEVDDVLLTSGGPMAIIQVGGFLGLGGRLVSMPLSEVRWNAERERLVLPDASKEALEARPAFDYDTSRRR
jgi:hypothetical protein